jgi:hypothetical protein
MKQKQRLHKEASEERQTKTPKKQAQDKKKYKKIIANDMHI